MPFINMYLKQGLSPEQTRACVREVTAAVAGSLENTLPRMVRVCIYEIPAEYMSDGGRAPDSFAPTLILQLGPGRSDEAVQACLRAVVSAVHRTLDIPEETVRFYIERVPGSHFAIGGKLKNFGSAAAAGSTEVSRSEAKEG